MGIKQTIMTGAATMLLGLATIGAANAQGYYDGNEERIIVSPAHPLYGDRSLPSSRINSSERLVSVSLPVDVSDLDLRQFADREELAYRIHVTAREVCSRLDSHYPSQVYMPVTDSRTCIRDTTNEAMAMAYDIKRNRY